MIRIQYLNLQQRKHTMNLKIHKILGGKLGFLNVWLLF